MSSSAAEQARSAKRAARLKNHAAQAEVDAKAARATSTFRTEPLSLSSEGAPLGVFHGTGPPRPVSRAEQLFFYAYTAVAVGGVALLLGYYYYAEHLFPQYGFLTGVLAGTSILTCPMVPCYFDPDVGRAFDWHASDVVVASGAEEPGSWWALNAVHQLRTGGDPTFQVLLQEAPWLELKDYPKQRTAELAARRAHSVPAADGFVPSLQRPFRLLATHLAPAGHAQAHRLAQLPLRDDVRYVVAVSSGDAAARGGFAFANSHSKRWAKTWGGFPRRHDNLTLFMENTMLGELNYYHGVLAAWLAERHRANVLFVHDADRRRDPHGALRRLAAFLEVAVVEAAWPALWEYTSDAWVAQHAGDTKYRNGKKGKRFRAWAPGWKETVPAALSPAQAALLERAAVRWIPDEAERRWAAEGGVLPPRHSEAEAAASGQVAEAGGAGGACSAEELAAVPTGCGGAQVQ